MIHDLPGPGARGPGGRRRMTGAWLRGGLGKEGPRTKPGQSLVRHLVLRDLNSLACCSSCSCEEEKNYKMQQKVTWMRIMGMGG